MGRAALVERPRLGLPVRVQIPPRSSDADLCQHRGKAGTVIELGERALEVLVQLEDGYRVWLLAAQVEAVCRGAELRSERLRLGITQETVARSMGVVFSYVSRLELSAWVAAGQAAKYRRALEDVRHHRELTRLRWELAG